MKRERNRIRNVIMDTKSKKGCYGGEAMSIVMGYGTVVEEAGTQ